ncbi:hypothetical protein [Tunturiibacter gelidiferens]
MNASAILVLPNAFDVQALSAKTTTGEFPASAKDSSGTISSLS